MVALRLKIHPIKSQLFQTRYGASFVGFRVLGDRMRVRNHNLRQGRNRLCRLKTRFSRGEISSEPVRQSIQSWKAHLEHGDTWRLRQHVFRNWEEFISHPNSR